MSFIGFFKGARCATPPVLAFGAAMMMLSHATLPVQAQAQEETIVIARDMDLDTLDPHRAFCDTCQIYLSAVYERLVDLAADNRSIVPLLAREWSINDDQTEFTFNLDPDARFADGETVTSTDVKWSLERLKNLQGNPSFLMNGVTDIDDSDPGVVVIRTEAPNSELLGILAAPYAAIVQSELAIANGAVSGPGAESDDQAEGWFLSNSAGSGAFVLSSYAPDDELRLVRNDEYWREAGAIRQVVIRQVKDAVTQAQMLESGAVDIAMQVDADIAATVRAPNVIVETVPSFNFVYIAFGAGADGMPIEMSRTVREALALAIDYDGAIEFVVGGAGAKQAAPIPNGFPGTQNLPLPERDIGRALALLAEEGHENGFTLEAVYPSVNVYGVDLSLLMQKVQQDLADVGVQLELQPVTFAVWRERIMASGIPVTAVYYAPDYFGSGQYAQFFGMQEGSPWHGRAHAAKAERVTNPRMAELLEAALAAPSDQIEAAFQAVAEEMIEDRIIIPILSPNLILAYRDNLQGMRYSACCNLPLGELSLD
ncbi:ABC transporter substrate-binding protein [Saliniramus fredricksonii]|uniref:Peptide/nickel transport system substrate-binding protein n=1 Tax=Saliniramus fredricksonii TaxID=1653334 RepID=A0ABY0K9K4_9HYPH|nr:ABC transporter substrate-binding protein [Saliniramus fredricksonii]SCC81150.1 peptide/nickel transport system substrate-binding protein [Saliniramus fredricksonii]